MAKKPTSHWLDHGTELTKTEFDAHCEAEEFIDGPHMEAFGDGYGEPYQPDRRAFGTLKDGKKVWAWVRGSNVKK